MGSQAGTFPGVTVERPFPCAPLENQRGLGDLLIPSSSRVPDAVITPGRVYLISDVRLSQTPN